MLLVIGGSQAALFSTISQAENNSGPVILENSWEKLLGTGNDIQWLKKTAREESKQIQISSKKLTVLREKIRPLSDNSCFIKK